MAKVKATVREGKSFTYKGTLYKAGDEVTFLTEKAAEQHESLDYVKLDREAEKKVQAAAEKKK